MKNKSTFPVYAGSVQVYGTNDTNLVKARLTLSEPLSEWTGWAATWRPERDSDESLDLPVLVDLVSSIVTVKATPELSNRIGVWDVVAHLNGVPRVWFHGETTGVVGVTR